MLKQIAIGGAVVVIVPLIAVVGMAAGKPDTFKIERSVVIEAPADKVYPLIADFRQWDKWSPFEKLDPKMKKTFEGPAMGKGAGYGWSGEGHAGEGHMRITETTSPSSVTIKLDFTKPMVATNDTRFTLAPEGKGTKVTWAMSGKSEFASKVMDVLMNMDAMLGKEFESGLASMKAVAEKR